MRRSVALTALLFMAPSVPVVEGRAAIQVMMEPFPPFRATRSITAEREINASRHIRRA